MKISVVLEALTGSFETDINRAAKTADKRLKDIEKSAIAAGKVIGTALVAGAAAFAALTKNAINAADDMSKLAQTTGLTTEALSQLSYAADLSGVEDLGGSLVKFNRTIAEAAQGTKAQAEAFARLGIAVKDSDGKLRGTEQLLGDVAQAFSQYEDGAAKSALAQELFGKSGAQLIPFLNMGRDGIQELRDEADALGITLSQQTGQAAEQFNDNLSRLNYAVKGLALRAAEELLPALVSITNGLVDSAKNGGTLDAVFAVLRVSFQTITTAAAAAGQVFQFVGTSVGAVAAALVQAAQGNFSEAANILTESSRDIKRQFQETGEFISRVWAPDVQFSLSNAGRAAQQAGEDTRKALDTGVTEPAARAAKSVRDLGDDAARAAKQLEDMVLQLETDAEFAGLDEASRVLADLEKKGASTEQLARAIDALALAQQRLGEADKAAQSQRDLNDAIAEAGRVAESVRTPVEQLQAEIVRLNELRNTFNDGEPLITDEQYRRAVENAQKTFDETAAAAERTSGELDEFTKEAARGIQDSLADFLFDPADKGFKGLLKGAVDTIKRIAAEFAAAQLAKFLFGDFGGAGGGNIGGVLGQVGAAIFGGAFADGGNPPIGKVSLVGERGPELIVPRSASTVIPMAKAGGRSGDTYNSFSFVVQAQDGQITRNSQRQAVAAFTRAQRQIDRRQN